MKKMKPLFIFLLLPFLMGCGKKPENTMPRDDFESLMGKNLPAWEHVQTQEDWDNLAFFKAVFEKNKSFIEEHAVSARIPKVIHFIWMGPRPFPRESVENVRSWIGKNPTWKVKFWTDRDRPLPHPSMEKVMIKDFHFSKLADCFSKSDNYGEKSDILRYEILLNEGGVYVDHDVKCVHAFDSLHEMFDLYCGMEVPYKTGLSSCVLPTNNIVGSRPGHPILKYCLDWLSENWDQIERDYPGQDRESIINRVSHRTFLVLGQAFKLLGNSGDNRDMVFPSFYFNAPKDEWALFARHQYAGTWFENESKFEKTTRERLMYLSKKSNKIILLCCVMGIFNVLSFGVLILLYRRLRLVRAGGMK